MRDHPIYCTCPDHPAGGESPWLAVAGVICIAAAVLLVWLLVSLLHLLVGAAR